MKRQLQLAAALGAAVFMGAAAMPLAADTIDLAGEGWRIDGNGEG